MPRATFFISFLLFICCAGQLRAQELGLDHEEILVYLKVQGVGGYEINSIYSYNDNRLLLPVTDLFTVLRINQETSERYDTVRGYLLDEDKPYLINYPGRYIAINGDTIQLKENDVLKTSFGLFMHTAVFGRAFGLYCTFSFRALSVDLKTDLELPAIRDMRLAQMRKNIEMLKGEVSVDTTYNRKYHWFKFGMFDWAVNLTQTDGDLTNNRVSAAIGAEFLGGETNALLNYSSNQDFQLNNQQFTWRWANNKSKLVRQVIAGKLSPGSIASVYDPFYGIIVTNSPTSYRRSFGEYELTGYTEPGWTAELYINNVLVSYKKADASGFYSFDVPLVYGSSEVVTKFYGPYGEERIREQPISIPYNFLPTGELEYTIRGGMVDDTMQSNFARAELNYGVNRFMTLGGGYEYYSYLPNNDRIPFIRASFSPAGNLLITGEYADKVRAQALMSYRTKNNASFEVEYARYEPGQEAIRFNYLEERRINVSLPINLLFFKGYTRMGFKQNIFENFAYNTAEFLLSTNIGPVSTNFTTNANWTGSSKPFFNTNLSGSLRLPRGFSLRSQMQFSIEAMEVMSYRVELEKRIARQGYASVNYEDNLLSNTRSVNVSFRYDLAFAQTSATARFGNSGIQTTQGVAGSLAFGSGNGYVHPDNRSVTGRGGLTIVPFLDINFNNEKDEDEPIVPEIDLMINGGRFLDREKDSLTRIMDLEPYTSYLIELKNDGFENIAWQLRDKAIRVHVDPNQFKRIDIPVFPMGEVNGVVYIRKGRGRIGQGRILINIYSADSVRVKQIMSEHDGYFTFLGLAPGDYFAKLDPVQMGKLGWNHEPDYRKFSITPSEWGDIVDGIDFTISKSPQEIADAETETETVTTKDQPTITPLDEIIKPEEELLMPSLDIFAGNYYVQTASCPTEEIAFNELASIENLTAYPSGVVAVDNRFKVRLGYFETREAALACRNRLLAENQDAFIGTVKGNRGKVVVPATSTAIAQNVDSDNTKASGHTATDQKTTSTEVQKPSTYLPGNLSPGNYYVQTASLSTKGMALQELSSIESLTDYPSGIVKADGSFKVRLGYFANRESALACMRSIQALNRDAFIGMVKKSDQEILAATEPDQSIEENVPDKSTIEQIPEQQEELPATNLIPASTATAGTGELNSGNYFVQTASCPTQKIAEKELAKVQNLSSHPVAIVQIDGRFKVWHGYFNTRSQADACKEEIATHGFSAFVGSVPQDEKPEIAAISGIKDDPDPPVSENQPQQSDVVSLDIPVDSPSGKAQDDFNPDRGGYFVQSASLANESNALQELAKVSGIVNYPSGIVKTDGRYKVRFGYFKSKQEASQCLQNLRDNGFDAFIGQSDWETSEPQVIQSDLTDQPLPNLNNALNIATGNYYVQVVATESLTKAKELYADFSDRFSYNAGIVLEGKMYKVRLGYFRNSAEARLCYNDLFSKGKNAFIGIDKSNNTNVVWP